ncbi:sialin [Aplysia californica]|uniref:Sialin n=1 Tax=Aplysia californica TaxID=6500 RepID=A0ABM1A826_APLCA|nr:sialin [Aplysia californica]
MALAGDEKDENNEGAEGPEIEATPLLASSRLGLAIIGFLGFINVYAVRVNLSVAIVCMVNQTAIRSLTAGDNGTDSGSDECAAVSSDNGTSSDLAEMGSLEWDKTTQGTILGSFFWGYLFGQVPAGWFATKFGGKWVYGITMLIAAVATVFTPLLAEAHYIALIIVRVILGAVTGMTFPAMHAIWGNWAPPLERTKLMTFTYAGAQVGIVIGFPLSGFLCKYGFAGGWPSIFYVTGAFSLIWAVAWILLVSDSPSTHKRISDAEREYILSSLQSGSVTENKRDIRVPWLKIMTSLPVYAIIIANVASDWGAYTLLTNIPTYISEVLKFDIAANGLVSALPYIAFWIVINLGGWVADFVRDRKLLTTGVTRKAFNAFGKILPAIMLISLGYVDCSQPTVAIALLVLAVSLTGTQYSGFLVNHVDIAPAFAGILFGISNSIAAVTGFISPVIVGVITEERQTRAEWQIVFYVAAAIYIFGAVFYIIFASGELQPWARVETSGTTRAANHELAVNSEGENLKMLQEGEATKV